MINETRNTALVYEATVPSFRSVRSACCTKASPLSASIVEDDKRSNKHGDGVKSGGAVLELEPACLLTKGNLLALSGGVSNFRLRVANKELLAVRHGGRVNGVRDGSP